jgi:hypothetical protein
MVIGHQCEQHPCVGGRADPSHNLYFPGGFCPDVWGCPSCNESGTLQGSANGAEDRVSGGQTSRGSPRDSSTHLLLAAEAPPGRQEGKWGVHHDSTESIGPSISADSPQPGGDGIASAGPRLPTPGHWGT